MQNFLTALGFLTRMGPSRVVEDHEFAAVVPWLPMVGAVLGLVLVSPLAGGLLSGRPWVQALLLVAASVWLTRGLHWDGWADVWDGWGSGAEGEKFFEIAKDSSVGAFGAMGLVLGLGGMAVLAHEALTAGTLAVLAWSFVLGRGMGVAVMVAGRGLERPGLGQLFVAGADNRAVFLVAGQILVAGLVLAGPMALGAGLVLCWAGWLCLRRVARRAGGLNGDFIGAGIVWGEAAALLGWVLAG